MEPTHPTINTASTVMGKCALIALLLSGLIYHCSAECHRQPVMHVIHKEGCNTRRVPSFGCRGTCTSYSRVSPMDYTQLERSCQCCQEANHVVRQVKLNCPGLLASDRNVEVRMVTSCTCRPCNGVPGVPNQIRLEDLLQ